jgi:hypothetical protein
VSSSDLGVMCMYICVCIYVCMYIYILYTYINNLGVLQESHVYELPPGAPDEQAVRIFLMFERQESAMKAVIDREYKLYMHTCMNTYKHVCAHTYIHAHTSKYALVLGTYVKHTHAHTIVLLSGT